MDVRFFVDENLGLNLVLGLRLLGHENIEHLTEKFKSGEKDEVWLEYVGQNNLVLISKDQKIRSNPKQKALLKKYKIVAFYLHGEFVGIQQISKQLIISWDKIEARAKTELKRRRPIYFVVRPKGGKIDEFPLE